jgi:hypothetical protein
MILFSVIGGLSGCPERAQEGRVGSPDEDAFSDQGFTCDAMALAGLEISFASELGAERFQVVIQDGGYVEELSSSRIIEQARHTYSGAFERPGTYDVRVYLVTNGQQAILYRTNAVVPRSQGPCHQVESTVKVEF